MSLRRAKKYDPSGYELIDKYVPESPCGCERYGPGYMELLPSPWDYDSNDTIACKTCGKAWRCEEYKWPEGPTRHWERAPNKDG